MGNWFDDVFLFTAVMAHRMATEDKLWDQAGYNLELWFASRLANHNPRVYPAWSHSLSSVAIRCAMTAVNKKTSSIILPIQT